MDTKAYSQVHFFNTLWDTIVAQPYAILPVEEVNSLINKIDNLVKKYLENYKSKLADNNLTAKLFLYSVIKREAVETIIENTEKIAEIKSELSDIQDAEIQDDADRYSRGCDPLNAKPRWISDADRSLSEKIEPGWTAPIVECFEGGYELRGAPACVVQSKWPDCPADGERDTPIGSGDHGMGAD